MDNLPINQTDEAVQLPPIPAGSRTYDEIIEQLWRDIPQDMIDTVPAGNTNLSYIHVWFLVGLLEHCASGFLTTSSQPFIGPLGQVSVRVSVYIPTSDRGWVRRDNFGTENPYVPDITPDGQTAPYGYGWERDNGVLLLGKNGNYLLKRRPAERMDAVTNAWAQGFARVVSSYGLSIGLRWSGNKRQKARLAFFQIIGGAPGAMIAGVPLAADYEGYEDPDLGYLQQERQQPPARSNQSSYNGNSNNGGGGNVVPATESQINTIYAAGRSKRGLDKVGVTALCIETFKRKPEALTKPEASRFIDTLNGKATPTSVRR